MSTAILSRPVAAWQTRRRGANVPETWAIFGLVSVGTFMTTLDGSIVNIALPSIAGAFGSPISGPIEWVVIGYLVVIAASLLTFGRLADIAGRSRVWTAGLAIFTAGSARPGWLRRCCSW
jgi:MFS family permease